MSTAATIATMQALPADVVELPAEDRAPARLHSLPREGKLWLFATAVMFATGLFKGINLLVYLAYLLAGIWLVNYWSLRSSLRRVQARRIPAGPIFAGEPQHCSIEIGCSGKRPLRGLVVFDWTDAGDRKWFVMTLEPAVPLRIQMIRTFEVRGKCRIDALRIHSGFPFGLFTRGIRFGDAEEWLVLPRLGFIDVERMKHWLARSARGDGRTHRRQLLPSAQEGDIHGLRDYRNGDSPRWIHWKSSARRSQLLVCEFEESSQAGLVLVVEPWLPEIPDQADRLRLESIISLAGTLVRDWCKDLSHRLTMIIAGAMPTVLANGAGRDFALHAMETLAVERGFGEDRSISWLDDARRFARSSPVVVVSSKRSSTMADSIGGELGRPVARLDADDQPSWYEAPHDPSE